jgi:hypothetical protein
LIETATSVRRRFWGNSPSGEYVWYLSNGIDKPFFAKLLEAFARETGAGRDRIKPVEVWATDEQTRAYSQHGNDTPGNVGFWILQGLCHGARSFMTALGTAYMASEVGGEEKNIFTPNEIRRAATTAIV